MSMVKPQPVELIRSFQQIVNDFKDEVDQFARQVENVAHFAENGESCDEDYDSTLHVVRMVAQSWEGVRLAWRDVEEARG